MDPTTYCDSILKNIKASNLHYILNENPFSLKVTIRKKFIENRIRTAPLIPIPGENMKLKALQNELCELKNSLEAKTKRFEEVVERENYDLKVELVKISDELVDSKKGAHNLHFQNKDVTAEIVQQKNMNTNLKRERKNMIKIAEKYTNDTREELKTKDDAITILERQIIQLEEKNNHQHMSSQVKNSTTTHTISKTSLLINQSPVKDLYPSLLTNQMRSLPSSPTIHLPSFLVNKVENTPTPTSSQINLLINKVVNTTSSPTSSQLSLIANNMKDTNQFPTSSQFNLLLTNKVENTTPTSTSSQLSLLNNKMENTTQSTTSSQLSLLTNKVENTIPIPTGPQLSLLTNNMENTTLSPSSSQLSLLTNKMKNTALSLRME